MGSRLQIAMLGMALARIMGWDFCVIKNDMVGKSLVDLPICTPQIQRQPKTPYHDWASVTKSGVYSFTGNYAKTMILQLKSFPIESVLTQEFIQAWRNVILQPPGTPSNTEQLWDWQDKSAIRVAVHIRRGDVTAGGPFRYAYTPDTHYIPVITNLRAHLTEKYKRPVDVHVFSENYGDPNWTGYQNVVDHFHFQPNYNQGAGNLTANIRDWRHFVQADVLLIGGTFSATPDLPTTDCHSLLLYNKPFFQCLIGEEQRGMDAKTLL